MSQETEEQDLKKTQRRLLKLALTVYEDQLAGGEGVKEEVRQAAANKVLEMHGLIGKQSGPNVDFHLAIPPEYFGEVFRGLQRITVVAKSVQEAEEAEVKEVSGGATE